MPGPVHAASVRRAVAGDGTPDVGIDGPRFSDINAPVSILQIDKAYILFDGYHRAFKSILKQETSIQGYVLQLTK